MPTVLIAGGTGLIGTRLTTLLQEKGYEVWILSRSAGEGRVVWDIESGMIDMEAVSKADYIIQLAGASVSEKRWTSKRKEEIQFSRVASSALLVKALKETTHHVKAVISASAIGWYGADNELSAKAGFTETDPPSNGFLGETCKLWEAAIDPVNDMHIRLVKLRTGIVLSREGGALVAFQKPVQAGIAAILGNGDQEISWIHIDDLCRIYIYCLEHENIEGVFNAVAPATVSNKKLQLSIAQKIKGKYFIPIHIPAFLLKLVLGEMRMEVLKSTTVSCAKIKAAGFHFYYPSLEAALNNLYPE